MTTHTRAQFKKELNNLRLEARKSKAKMFTSLMALRGRGPIGDAIAEAAEEMYLEELNSTMCGFRAAAKSWEMWRDKIPSRILYFCHPPESGGEGHAVCIYQTPDKVVTAWEEGHGSVFLGRLDWDADKIAAKLVKGATRAKWLTSFGGSRGL